jgi:hypothetical protein
MRVAMVFLSMASAVLLDGRLALGVGEGAEQVIRGVDLMVAEW